MEIPIDSSTAYTTTTTTASSTSSCSFSSHSTINTTHKEDTQKAETSKSKQELWHIIEKQRAIIQELQKALLDVTAERDDLLLKNKSIPTPPPRSPFRSNNHGETTDNHYTQKTKSIPSALQSDNKVRVKVRSVHSNRFVVAIIDAFSGKELWTIEKTYTDLIHLNHTLHKKLQVLFNLSLDSADRKQRKITIEKFFKNVFTYQGDFSTVYSFISTKTSRNQQGYLSKRGKHNSGGWKSYYFILCESELKYFNVHQGDLYVHVIKLNHDSQIGKQTNDNSVETFEHAFVILQDSLPIILDAASDADRDKWVQALVSTTKKQCITTQPNLAEPKALPVRSSSYANNLKSKSTEQSRLLQSNHRSTSMDDQAILSYYEAIHQPCQQASPRTVVLKASADSLPLDLQGEEKKKIKYHRKSFWPRRKLFNNITSTACSPITTIDNSSNNSATTTINSTIANSANTTTPVLDASMRHTLSFPFIDNTEEGSSSGSSACSTPMFQVFGVPLEAAIRVSRISDRYELPAIVYRCIEYLKEKNAVLEEGIYRLSGSSVQISNLRQQFCEYGDVDLLNEKYADLDVHVVAGLLKAWLRELPINVLTSELLNDFLAINDIKDKQNKIQELGLLVSILPLANYTLLRTLIAHLIHIVNNAECNKMTLRNVDIVFAPTLSIPSGIFTLLLSEFEYIFWTKEQEIVVPESTTSADRIKNNYLKAEKRSNRNSREYKNQVPSNIISLENGKNSKQDMLIICRKD